MEKEAEEADEHEQAAEPVVPLVFPCNRTFHTFALYVLALDDAHSTLESPVCRHSGNGFEKQWPVLDVDVPCLLRSEDITSVKPLVSSHLVG